MTIQEAITKYFYTDSVPANGARIPLLGSSSNPIGSDTYANMAAKLGTFYYGECTTDATTAAKSVTISGFKLTTNSCLAIRFTKAIQATNPTLQVSLTGEKPLYYNGAPLGLNVVRAGNICLLQYDGTNYNIIKIEGLEESGADDNLYVDMGLPSGVLWAKSNIDLTQPNGFAASPYQYGCTFFSWGNINGQNPSGTTFPNSWGSVNAQAPYYDGQVYGSTEGNKLTESITPPFDAARVNLGAPWRMPTRAEFVNLFANITYIDANGDEVTTSTPSVDGNARGANDKRVKVNNIVGIHIQSNINGNTLFFPCSGYGTGTSLKFRSSSGYYWSSTLNNAKSARELFFSSLEVDPQNISSRFLGTPIRPVI